MTRTRTTLERLHDAAVTYHLLVALIFTACLPLTLARSLGGRADGDAGALGSALDTARAAAASAFSLPG